MIFYKHFLGDFDRDTSHLSMTERGAYLSLLHHYYATEEALPTDPVSLARIARAHTAVERKAVRSVMVFFEIRGNRLWHKRVEAELEKTGEKRDKNREIALAREQRRRAERESRNEHETCNESDTNGARNVHEPHHENNTTRTRPDSRRQSNSPLPRQESTTTPDSTTGEVIPFGGRRA